MTSPLKDIEVKIEKLIDFIVKGGLFTRKQDVMNELTDLKLRVGELEYEGSEVMEMHFRDIKFKRDSDGALLDISALVFNTSGEPVVATVVDPTNNNLIVNQTFDLVSLVNINC